MAQKVFRLVISLEAPHEIAIGRVQIPVGRPVLFPAHAFISAWVSASEQSAAETGAAATGGISRASPMCVGMGRAECQSLTCKVFLVYVPAIGFWRAEGRVFRFGRTAITLFGQMAATGKTMKIRNSLKALKGRHRENRMVRRKGRIYIINKQNPRYKARQG